MMIFSNMSAAWPVVSLSSLQSRLFWSCRLRFFSTRLFTFSDDSALKEGIA